MRLQRPLAFLSWLACLGSVTSAHGQTIPLEGTVAVTFTATDIPPPKRIAIGGGREFAVVVRAMAASNDEGNPILNNMGGRCHFSMLFDTVASTVEQHGFCTYEDNDAHQIFEQCDFVPGAPNNCKVTGGTGKFEGLQASVVITAQPVKSSVDGIAQIVGHKRGTYRITK
jgi:hypothetical protein